MVILFFFHNIFTTKLQQCGNFCYPFTTFSWQSYNIVAILFFLHNIFTTKLQQCGNFCFPFTTFSWQSHNIMLILFFFHIIFITMLQHRSYFCLLQIKIYDNFLKPNYHTWILNQEFKIMTKL